MSAVWERQACGTRPALHECDAGSAGQPVEPARPGGGLVSRWPVVAGISDGPVPAALTNFLMSLSNSRDGARAVTFWMPGWSAGVHRQAVPLLAVRRRDRQSAGTWGSGLP